MIIVALLIISFNVYSSDNPLKDLLAEVPHKETLTSNQIRHIQNELRLQSIIIEGVEKIRLEGGKFVNINTASSTTRDIILQTSLSKYIFRDEVQKQRLKTAINEVFKPQNLRNNLTKISELGQRFVSWQGKLFTTTARNQGVLYALVKFISIQLDTTVPAILIGTGNFAIGAGLLSAPVSPVALFPFKVLKDTIKNLALVKRLGLKEAVNQYKLNSSVKAVYRGSVLKQMNLINAHFDGQQYILSYQRENILSSFFKKRNYKSLTLSSVLDFLSEYPEYDDFISKIKSSRVSPDLKLLTLITSVENHADDSLIAKFLERYKDSIFKTGNIDIPKSHRSWILKVSHSKDFNTFYHHLRTLPNDIHPQILERVWKSYVIPSLAEEIEGQFSLKSYQAFQELNSNFEKKLKTKLMTSNSYFDSSLRSEFINLVFQSLEKAGGCGFIYTPLKRGIL